MIIDDQSGYAADSARLNVGEVNLVVWRSLIPAFA